MSLRAKIVGTLMGGFALYVLVAWLVLELIHAPTFDNIERKTSLDQLDRVLEFIATERKATDAFVIDWAQWDDAMEFALGNDDTFYEDNLSEANLAALGLSFGAIVDRNGNLIFGEFYGSDDTIMPVDELFSTEIEKNLKLLEPTLANELTTGLIATTKGPATISSAAILWNSGEGPPGGHLIVGKLLDSNKLNSIGQTLRSPINILPLTTGKTPTFLISARDKLLSGQEVSTVIFQDEHAYGLALLKDVSERPIGLLQVSKTTDIAELGAIMLRSTITTLIVAAFLLTFIIWVALKGIVLIPIEQLTSVLRGRGNDVENKQDGDHLLSTVNRLAECRGAVSDRNDELGELIKAFDELSTSLKDASTKIWHVAHSDGLTGLANRRFFIDSLRQQLVNTGEAGKVTVLFIDLDEFKQVNDEYGHETGDKLLQEVALRLQSVVCPADCIDPSHESKTDNMIARIGGDEFVALLTGEQASDISNHTAERIVTAVGAPFFINNRRCDIGACVGLATYPDDATDVEGILSAADAAMYEAKRAGKNTWRRYIPGLSRLPEQKRA